MQKKTNATQEFAQAQIESGKNHSLYQDLKDAIEKPYLVVMLKAHYGNQSKCAEALGINRATLRTKMKRHGLI